MRTQTCTITAVLFFIVLLAGGLRASAETNPADLDPTFVPPNISGGPGGVRGIAVQPDGKVIIAGFFALSGVSNSQGLLRLNSNGTVDSSFQCEVFVGGGGRCVALQPDGKILVGGNTFSASGFFGWGLVRLNANGSLDRTFDPGVSVEPTVDALAVQPDGKILAGGGFDRGITRLNSDGAPDLTFDPGSGTNNDTVVDIALQDDGKIVLVGGFDSVNGYTRDAIARLQPNGNVDSAFVANNWLRLSWIRSVAVQHDGKILIGGYFDRSSWNNASNDNIARLNADGTVDTSFVGNASNYVECVECDRFGRILIGGWFTAVNGSSRNYIARLHPDGSLDQDFNTYTGPSYRVYAVSEQTDMRILFGGDFQSVYGTTRRYVARFLGGPAPSLSLPSVSISPKPNNIFELTHDSQPGFKYRLQKSQYLATWEDWGSPVRGTGISQIWSVTMTAPQQFWRVVVEYE